MAPRRAAWRVRAPGIPVEVRDEFAGAQTFDLRTICGDFVIFKNDGTCAYQLAVVVDDAAAGVTAIVRGDDLLDSAARQIHLRRLLRLPQNVRYWHLPLVVGPDGRRLAKRHGDTRISHYRQLGATRERILGLLAYWSGLLDSRRETDMAELLSRFDLSKLPKEQVVFQDEDDRFLRGGSASTHTH
jgi:glutamyl-tRNA synthetase